MKGTTVKWITIAVLLLATAWAGSMVSAQEQPAGQRGGASLEDRFKQLDRNGDGKLTRDEIPRLMDQLDANRDGGVTLEEARAYYRGRAGAAAQGDSKAAAPPLLGKDSLGLKFSRDYKPGTRDASGQWSGGTETMEIRAYGGKLFASLGYWMDVPYAQPKGDEPWTGAQVLVKDSAAASWRVDVGFGGNYLRTEALVEVSFTTDAKGRVLKTPVKMLVAGPSDVNITGERWATAWTRDDTTGRWTKTEIALELRSAGARSFASHRDKVTGIHHIFAGVSCGRIYRGVYDPDAPGRLRWHAEPELSGTGRPMCMAEAEGVLYAACGIKDDSPQSGGLFRRVDGPQPRWEMVYRWPYNLAARGDEMRILRGLTAVRDPLGGVHEVLLGTRNFGGVIQRIDPTKNFAVTTELDIRDFFAKLWDVATYRGPTLSAYNRFVPASHPVTGEKIHLIGVAVIHPQAASPPHNGSFFLVRRAEGRYEGVEIYDPDHPVPAGAGLDGTRAIEVSPFPEDQGRVFYFGGHDCANRNSHNTAWIYKGTLPHMRKEKP